MKIYGFIGPSGTGKSHRAQYVANINNIDYIIDDALLISQTKIIAGKSAKTEATKIASVKSALFLNEDRQNEIKKALKDNKVEKLLILGTSDGMVDKIALNLALPKVYKRIYIQDVATNEEMEEAKKIRKEEGKHVIPVPTFEIKEQFSGYFLTAIKDLFIKNDRGIEEVTEKSIIRPTFSYLGKYTIADEALKMIMSYTILSIDGIVKVNRIVIKSRELGIDTEIDITMKFGYKINPVVKEMALKIRKDMEQYTGITSMNISIQVKHIEV